MKRRKSAEHRAEMEARAERRAERSKRAWQEGPTPDRAKAPPTSTPPEARRVIAKNKTLQDRRRLKRLSDAAATAEGRRWKPPPG
jgi:hypothetical protein